LVEIYIGPIKFGGGRNSKDFNIHNILLLYKRWLISWHIYVVLSFTWHIYAHPPSIIFHPKSFQLKAVWKSYVEGLVSWLGVEGIKFWALLNSYAVNNSISFHILQFTFFFLVRLLQFTYDTIFSRSNIHFCKE
jgi:hypothetical protein